MLGVHKPMIWKENFLCSVAVWNCPMLRCLARLCPLVRSIFAKGVHAPLYFSQVARYGCT